MTMNLQEIRQEIDHIDAQIAPLLRQRMECSRAVAESKRESHSPVLNRKREQEILSSIASAEHGSHLAEIYRTIMGESRAFQYDLLDTASEVQASLDKLPKQLPDLELGVFSTADNILPELSHADSLEALLKAVAEGDYGAGILYMEQYSSLDLAMQMYMNNLHFAERVKSGTLMTITRELYCAPDARNTALLFLTQLSSLPWCLTRIQEANVPLFSMATQLISEDSQAVYLELSARPDTLPMKKLLAALTAETAQLYILGIY